MGFPPDRVVGKHSPAAYEVALDVLGLGADRVLMIGDRLDTDIAGAQAAGLDSALVLTGVSTLADVDRCGIRPTWVARSFADLCAGRLAPPEKCDVGKSHPEHV
jgi:glycerol 3-phosphatase-2